MQADRTFQIVDATGATTEADFDAEVIAADASVIHYGEIDVLAADSGTVTVSDTTSYFELTGTATWTLGANRDFDSPANGRLRYTAPATVEASVTAVVSMTAAASNQVLYFRFGINGTTQAATEVHRKVGNAADVGAMPMTALLPLSQNDYVSIFVRNTTGINNVSIEASHISIITIPQ